jgi:steroid 5-alpha reductase family enzyme
VLLTRPIQAAIGYNWSTAFNLCFISPFFATYLLLRVSGVPISEKKYDKLYGGRKEYQEWKRNTPMFFPKIF